MQTLKYVKATNTNRSLIPKVIIIRCLFVPNLLFTSIVSVRYWIVILLAGSTGIIQVDCFVFYYRWIDRDRFECSMYSEVVTDRKNYIEMYSCRMIIWIVCICKTMRKGALICVQIAKVLVSLRQWRRLTRTLAVCWENRFMDCMISAP